MLPIFFLLIKCHSQLQCGWKNTRHLGYEHVNVSSPVKSLITDKFYFITLNGLRSSLTDLVCGWNLPPPFFRHDSCCNKTKQHYYITARNEVFNFLFWFLYFYDELSSYFLLQ